MTMLEMARGETVSPWQGLLAVSRPGGRKQQRGWGGSGAVCYTQTEHWPQTASTTEDAVSRSSLER